jgi:hypothetical protein
MFLTNQTNGVGNVMMDAEEYLKDRLIQEMINSFKIMHGEADAGPIRSIARVA